MTDNDNFKGPLFVVGMPRSGTKLLRDLLNNHNDIFIPPNESKIIPFLINKFGHKIPEYQLSLVLDEWYSSTFYSRISNNDCYVDRKKLEEGIIRSDEIPISHILETFYKILSKEKGAKIWGDKTPTYLKHYTLLMKMYPDARFVHIVRDVRDYCLSINKAWGKHMIRASHRWDQSLKEFTSQINHNNVLHIKYEILITDPQTTLNSVCDFLEIPYSRDLISLNKPSESLGDAKGFMTIKKDNSMKWVQNLSEKEIRKIEKTSSDMMRFFEYELQFYSDVSRAPSLFSQGWFKIFDGVNLLKFHINRLGGFASALKFMTREYKRRV